MSRKIRRIPVAARLLILALIIPLVACNKAAEKPSAKEFSSADDAGNALWEAAKSGDPNAIVAILGPESKELVSSGDAVQDKAAVDGFAAAYPVMHRWRKMPDGAQMLLVGADNFPFPIPLKKNTSGQWYFDTAAGKDEILNRRIGRNELAAIDICEAFVDAQAEYFSQRRDGASVKQYAVKFISDTGRQNGLYWSRQKGNQEARSGRWRHLQRRKVIAPQKQPLALLSMVTTSECSKSKALMRRAERRTMLSMEKWSADSPLSPIRPSTATRV